MVNGRVLMIQENLSFNRSHLSRVGEHNQDAVLDILTVVEDEISAIPDAGGEECNPYLDGLITQNDRMVAAIALDRLIKQASSPGGVTSEVGNTNLKARANGEIER